MRMHAKTERDLVENMKPPSTNRRDKREAAALIAFCCAIGMIACFAAAVVWSAL